MYSIGYARWRQITTSSSNFLELYFLGKSSGTFWKLYNGYEWRNETAVLKKLTYANANSNPKLPCFYSRSSSGSQWGEGVRGELPGRNVRIPCNTPSCPLVAHVVWPVLVENVRWNTFWYWCNIQTDVRNIGLTCVTYHSSMLPIWLLVWY